MELKGGARESDAEPPHPGEQRDIQMNEYYPLIARAVEGLDRSTGASRRVLYERARNALVAQLRSNEPALLEADITKERLALEEAIRKVEADAARKSRSESRAEQRTDPRLTAPAASTPEEAPQVRRASGAPRRDQSGPPLADLLRTRWTALLSSARKWLLSGRSSLKKQGGKGFRDVVGEVHDLGAATAKAAQTQRQTREAYEPEAPQYPSAAEEPGAHRFEPHLEAEHLTSADYDARQRDLEPAYERDDEPPVQAPPTRYTPRSAAASAEEEYDGKRPPLFYGGLARLVVILIILAGVVAAISWQWSAITGLYQYLSHIGSKPQIQQAGHETPSVQPKFSGRVPQEQSAEQAPGAAAPSAQTAPAVAQRIVLYEEDPNDQQGRRYVGSALWRTETVSPGPGLAPELTVRADVEIPERRMTVTWSLRRNTDKALPASHTIEIMFNLPADFPGGGIANVPGILMKQGEQERGTPLSGLAVKVTNGFFLIGLSTVDTDLQRNVQLLKDRSWFDIPIVYTNGGRAILAMEKGPPGDRAFVEAFAGWEKK
jgi:hypothetical protein